MSSAPRTAGSVMVVGPGSLFLSGVSQYTARLAHAFTDAGYDTSVLLLRRLCPKFVYPGRDRLGADLANLSYPADAARFDGIDWFWGTSLPRALWFLRRVHPDRIVLQWWTGTVAHTYLALIIAARLLGIAVVIEFHEVLDVGEARLPLVGRYVRAVMAGIVARADGIVVHSTFDAEAVSDAYQLPDRVPVAVVRHAPFDQYTAAARHTDTPVTGTLRLLYAGVIRPYKGLEDLAESMRIALHAGADVHLDVVGEVWQGYTTPLDLLAALPADRVTVRTGYLDDAEFDACFADADAVVLPYRRSSASGPLAIAMSKGLPVVTTAVGGLVEAAAGYTGARLVPPGDPAALAEALADVRDLTGRSHRAQLSWADTAAGFGDLFARVGAGR